MALPRRLIVVAVSAVAAGAFLYVSSKLRQGQRKGAVDEANDEKERVVDEKRRADDKRAAAERTADKSDGAGHGERGASTATDGGAGAGSSSSPASTTPGAASGPHGAGAQQELALFLAGDAWHDEIGWQALWEKEGVSSSSEWLRTKGRNVLVSERQKLAEHPALLAGCRRRWIVVCRYAGIDVGDAATIWNQSETG
jgi:hypothetical protein